MEFCKTRPCPLSGFCISLHRPLIKHIPLMRVTGTLIVVGKMISYKANLHKGWIKRPGAISFWLLFDWWEESHHESSWPADQSNRDLHQATILMLAPWRCALLLLQRKLGHVGQAMCRLRALQGHQLGNSSPWKSVGYRNYGRLGSGPSPLNDNPSYFLS